MLKNLSKLQCFTLTAMLAAIIFLLTFTPQIGFIQIPFIGFSATILHIPVIVGAILMGAKYGAILGAVFGLASMIFATVLSAQLSAFVFTPFRNVPGTDSGSPWAILIAFGPRILIGVVAALVYAGLIKFIPKITKGVAAVIAAGLASMTNTLLVLNLMYFMFREPWTYARANAGNEAPQITYAFIIGSITGAGIPEAIAAMVIAPAVCLAIYAVAKRMPQKQGA